MTTLVWAVVCIVLAAAGAGLGYWFGNRHRAGESAKLEAVQAELDDYRKRVSEHFGETATRFHDLGRQYRELYEHMAAGSQDLCSVDDASGKLPFAPADRPAIAGGGQPEQDEPDSETTVQAGHVHPGSEESVQRANEHRGSGKTVQTENEHPDSAGSAQAEREDRGSEAQAKHVDRGSEAQAKHVDRSSEAPAQAEQEDPGSEEPVRAGQENQGSEESAQSAEESTKPAVDEDGQQPSDRTPEQSAERKAPPRTYH